VGAYAGHWAALALIFLVLSLDEAASSHEATIQPLRVTLGARGIFYFAWVIPGLALVGLLGVIYWGFMRALPPPTRTRFVGAAGIYVAAALGMEMVGGYVVNYYGQKNITFALLAAAEETLEMLVTAAEPLVERGRFSSRARRSP